MIKLKAGIAAPVLAFMAVFATSCKKNDAPDDLKSGIVRANMDTLVNPGDNFTAYVNGTWLKNTAIPSDKSGYGVWDLINDKAEEDVKK